MSSSVASWPVYRFLRRQVRWSGIPISFKNFPHFVVTYTVKSFSIVKEAEIDFLKLLFTCFSYDPVDVGNLTSGSTAFSTSSLCIWKFLVHVLLKPTLKDFEDYLASMWNERNCMVVWTFFGIAFLWDWNENWPFPVLWLLLNFLLSLFITEYLISAILTHKYWEWKTKIKYELNFPAFHSGLHFPKFFRQYFLFLAPLDIQRPQGYIYIYTHTHYI